ncbi:MAG TPA: hypothetical protein VKX34_02930 [Aequorivita sp.]|nr:hypothetical protein [Aequorivita sp.]
MNKSSLNLLESKLKRYKISYRNEKGTIKIGTSRIDYPTLIGLVILPIAGAVGIILLLCWNKTLSETYPIKTSLIAIFLLSGGLFYLRRIKKNKAANNSLKILENNIIKIKSKKGEFLFNSNSIKDFECSIDQLRVDLFEGNLYLIDFNDEKHQLLGIRGEDSKYILNDLKWFSEFFINYINISEYKLESVGSVTMKFSPEGN